MTSLTSAHDVDRPRAVAYVRVSTDAPKRNGDLEVQLNKIMDWAMANITDIDQVFREVQD